MATILFITAANFFITGRLYFSQGQLSLRLEQIYYGNSTSAILLEWLSLLWDQIFALAGIFRSYGGNFLYIILRATRFAAGSFWLFGVAIWGAWVLHFGTSGDHFGSSGASQGAISEPRDRSGGPWERQDGRKVVRKRICIDFGVLLGPVYISSLRSRSLNVHFVRACFQVVFFVDF